MPLLNNLCIFLRRFLSWYGITFGVISTLVLVLGLLHQEQAAAQLSTLGYFLFVFILGWYARQWGLSVIVFMLPLLPTLSTQVSSILPGIQLPVSISGVSVVAIFIFGLLIQQLLVKRKSFQAFVLPGSLNVAILFLTLSVALAIARNLWLSGSVFSFQGLLYNATHISLNGWRDDYYPLTDLLTYGIAASFIASVMVILREEKDPNTKLIQPILWGVIVAAAWAMIQNRTGYGLSFSSASGNRYYQMFGYASTGFQPDIHAFSAHMLLGAVGAWGCLFIKKEQLSRWLIVAAIVMGWAGLWASKSRGSILLASMIYLLAFGILLWRKNKLYFFITTSLLLLIASSTYVFHRWGLSIIPLWLIQYVESLPKLHISNLEALNAHFGHRAEIYHAALRMFQEFPLLGIGQGDFYTMSGIQSFAQSRFLGQIQGENAHNYFLQTLTETGLIGTVILCAVLVIPGLKSKNKQSMFPGYVLLLGIALGNLFAHALLVRENFFLLSAVIGLLYVMLKRSFNTPTDVNETSAPLTLIVLAVSTLVWVLAAQEAYRSFGNHPYVYGMKCYTTEPLKNNEWTTGLFDVQIPVGVREIEFHLSDVHPDVVTNPLGITISVLDGKSNTLSTQQQSIRQQGAQVFRVKIEPPATQDAIPERAVIQLSRCFTPRNFGFNSDTRRLGVLLKAIEFSK